MSNLSEATIQRLNKLGLICEAAPANELSSAVAALACIPMYMVSNVHGWTEDKQFKIPLLDIEGSEAVREAFVIGTETASLKIDKAHQKILTGLLRGDRPADLLIYEYALETLSDVLSQASGSLPQTLRTFIAKTCVAVAQAAGKGVLGTGDPVSPQERECIEQIDAALSLSSDASAKAHLDKL